MIKIATFRELALSFPDVTEQLHLEKTSFRISKKIFATLDEQNNIACVKLSLTNQDIFSRWDQGIIYPVPNKWGKQGWTFIQLNKVRKNILADALSSAYCGVAPKRLSDFVSKK